MSHEQNPPTFHYTGWLIGILIMVYYNPYITGYYDPQYTLNNQGFFIAQITRAFVEVGMIICARV